MQLWVAIIAGPLTDTNGTAAVDPIVLKTPRSKLEAGKLAFAIYAMDTMYLPKTPKVRGWCEWLSAHTAQATDTLSRQSDRDKG
jgi:hypothetical protein